MARYPVVYAGQRVTGTLLQATLPDVAYKATTESVAASTTLQDDNDLMVAVDINATYAVELILFYDADATVAGDIKIGWTAPTGAAMNWASHGAAATVTSSTAAGSFNIQTRLVNEAVSFGGGDSVGTLALVYGVLTTSTTAGVLQLQWAQDTSNAVPTNVRAGSRLTLRRIA
ncbi:hypothetical protein [Streptomyces sp. NPDC088789]|uniref:hypothetical protein n=1 Tax=Streptomyces sp. NPDC088789 TaxID=3365899 RepID=UPI0037FBA522